MARTVTLIAKLNGAAVTTLGVSLQMRLDGQTTASIDLDPTSTAALGVNETDSWDILLSYAVPAGGTTTQTLLSGGRARAAQYTQRYSGGSGDTRNVQVVRRVQVSDRLAAFRDYAPSTDTTRTGTDSHGELSYVCGQIGIGGAVASLARVPIDRIDYRRDQSYWETLWPYLAPFDPLVLLDPSTSALRLIDPTVAHSSSPRSDRVLTLADYNPAEWSTDLRPIITQVRVAYKAFGPATLGATVSPTATRREEDISENDDGSTTRTWTGYVDLHDDPTQPTTVTRSVVCEQGATTTAGSSLISQTITTMSYRADYSLLVETLTVVSGTADLPIVGYYSGELERTTETYEYDADPIVPGRYLLKKRTATTTGLYIYEYSSADPNGELSRVTGTPVMEASHAGTVDVRRSSGLGDGEVQTPPIYTPPQSSGLGDGEVAVTAVASTSQRFATSVTRTVVETYQRNHASGVVTVIGHETDSLRGKVVRTWRRTELGDNALTPAGRTAFAWVDGASTYGERRAAQVDATLVGLPIGRQIAERMLAQSGQPVRTARITLTRPDYRRYRLGWLVTLHADAPYSMAGLWFVRGVTFEAGPPSVETQPVVQTLDLIRMW